MAILEANTDLDIKGRVLATDVPNSTGSIVTWNSSTNVFGLRTNAQIIADLNLSSNFITTNTTQTGLTGNKTSNGIWTLGQVRKAGQTDTQMLLAGGGHRPVSDFALAGSLGNYVAKSGDTMTGALTIKSSTNAGKDVLLTLGRKLEGWGYTSFSQSYDNRYYPNGKTLDIDIDDNTYLSLASANNPTTGKIIAHKPIEYNGTTSDNWNTAFGWGNHAGRYLPLTGGTLTGNLRLYNNNWGLRDIDYTVLALTPPTHTGGPWNHILKDTSTNAWYSLAYNALKVFTINNAGTTTISGTVTAPTFIGKLSGNASTASTLATARTINGTSFNGSANIVTANWGTARNITIGSTTKSVNGSGNVSWSLAEIGASSVNHTHPISDIVGLQTELNKIGNLPSLTTTNKNNLVEAINEVNDSIPTNFITTNTNQTGLTGNKTTSGIWTFNSQSNPTLITLRRPTSLVNSTISFLDRNSEGFNIGMATKDVFAIGSSDDLSTNNVRWMWVDNLGNLNTKSDVNPLSGWVNGQVSSYPVHSIRLGGVGRNYMDFFEYGALWNFYRSNSTESTLVASIAGNKVSSNGYEIYGRTNSDIVLAGGGHRPVSDFALASSIITPNNGQLTLTTGTGLSGSATFTANQAGGSTFSVAVASTHKLPTTAEWNALPTTNTITRLRGTTGGTFTSGDLTLLAGANTTITQSGANITIASTNTNTTYSAGTGLSLTGTVFGQTITTSGTGTFVTGITQTTNGFQINLGTPPNTNTTYTGSNGINITGTVISPTYGTAAGTIAQGNDTRINNGQTAFGWGNHAGLYVSQSEYKNFGTITVSSATGSTSDFIATLTTIGFFNYNKAVGKASWNYAGNQDITDTPYGNIETAGAVIETWKGPSGNINIIIYCANTGGSTARRVFMYNDQGPTYSPGWREILTDSSPMTGYATQAWVTSQGFSTQTLTAGSNISIVGNVISATNTNTTYTAGTGLSLTGTTFANTAPNATHTGDVTGATALTIATSAVTFPKMQNIATQTFLGRATAGTGNVEALTVAQMQSLLGFSTQTLSNSTSNLIVSNTVQRAALTGDVTAAQNSNATTIANNAVTHAKYQNIATQRILGRGAAGTGNVQELTLGANLSLSTAGVLSATNTNTTYTAGTGLTLSGTTFGQTITTSGTGTFVTGITQTTNGFQVNLGTPSGGSSGIQSIRTDNSSSPGPAFRPDLYFNFHENWGFPAAFAEEYQPGNATAKAEDEQLNFFASYDSVKTMIEYDDRVYVGMEGYHIVNVLLMSGSGSDQVILEDGVYAGDQVNITTFPGGQINIYANNLIATVGNEVYTFANLIWDCDLVGWVITGYGTP